MDAERGCFGQFWKSFCRQKVVNREAMMQTRLERTLSVLDLMVIGIGATLGVSIYIMLGETAREIAGPSIVVSLLIDAVAAVMSGLCYAELSARMPVSGSAYTFTSAVIGEAAGFLIGWNLLFQYMIGTALFARGFTAYFDKILNGEITAFISSFANKIEIWGSSTYPDIFALLICLLITAAIAFGWKPTRLLMVIVVFGNIIILAVIVITGAVYGEGKNWQDFMPFGIFGTIKGASTCFYAFVGFDVIAMSSEKTKNPAKAVPIAILGTTVCCVVAFVLVAVTMTILVPYHQLAGDAVLFEAFDKRGLHLIGYLIFLGMVFALIGGLTATLIPMPKLAYALSQDGLIFAFLKKVSKKSNVPVLATLISGAMAGIVSLCFDLNTLIRMTSLGTLMTYTSVAACVILARYSVQRVGISPADSDQIVASNNNGAKLTESSFIEPKKIEKDAVVQTVQNNQGPSNQHTSLDNEDNPLLVRVRNPTTKSQRIVAVSLFFIIIHIIAISCLVIYAHSYIRNLRVPVIACLIYFIFALLISVVTIAMQTQNRTAVSFRMPLVPWLPSLSLSVNIYLLLLLDHGSWIRFGIWMALGCLIYFGYGMHHSKVNQHSEEREGYSMLD